MTTRGTFFVWVGLLVEVVGCTPPAPAPAPAPVPCDAAVQLEDQGASTLTPGDTAAGIEQCGDAFAWNRIAAVPCLADPPTAACGVSGGACAADEECGAGSRCLSDSEGGCACRDFCTSDDDCDAGSVCLCTAAVSTPGGDGEFTALQNSPQCVPADCRTNADCGEGGACGVALSLPCGAILGLRCRSADDVCRTSADCAGGDHCAIDTLGDRDHWTCTTTGTCG